MNEFDIIAAKLAALFFVTSLIPSLIFGVMLALMLLLAIIASVGLHGLRYVSKELAEEEDEDNTPATMSFLMAGWRRVYDLRVEAATDLAATSQAMRAIEHEVVSLYAGKDYVFDDGLHVTIRDRYFIVTPPPF